MDLYTESTIRNRGIIPSGAQKILKNCRVAIAGCGADGGSPALGLARMGVRHFNLADPDVFDISNINRQEGAFRSSVGKNKAEVIGKLINDIDDACDVRLFTDGITQSNVNRFINGVDLIIEEVDYRSMKKVYPLYDAAREKKIPIITGLSVAWDAYVFYFSPGGISFRDYMSSFSGNDGVSQNGVAPFLPKIPDYVGKELLRDVLSESINIPVIEPAVKLNSAMISAISYFILTGTRDIKPVPHYYSAGDLFLKKEEL